MHIITYFIPWFSDLCQTDYNNVLSRVEFVLLIGWSAACTTYLHQKRTHCGVTQQEHVGSGCAHFLLFYSTY